MGKKLEVITIQTGMGSPTFAQTLVQGTDSFDSVIHPDSFEGVFWTDTLEIVFRQTLSRV